MPSITETTFARHREEWRAWLAENHAEEKAIWLVFYKKKTGKTCVAYNDAVEEALCFGWIDGILKRMDEEKHAVRFTQRRPDSIWSEMNKARVARMIRAGRMASAGLAAVRVAKKRGRWGQTSARQRASSVVPEELESAFARNRRAREHFHNLAPSYRKMDAAWILDAKREETRQRRIRIVVERATRGQKPGIDM
jgi:uncharacterized protein YdeI (YjbR/CyaY-like superfamily)